MPAYRGDDPAAERDAPFVPGVARARLASRRESRHRNRRRLPRM